MPSPVRDCPNCHTRVHPLDLSDLHRGRRINCAHCGRGLSVSAAWWAMLPVGALAWWGLLQISLATELPFWLETFGAAVTVWLVTVLVRQGLVIEGAPWVSLTARDAPWDAGRSVFGIRLG